MAIERITESITGFDRIDRDAGIIRGVKIIQPKSKNGRRYLQEALQEAAPMYESMRVYIDHIDPEKKNKQRSKSDRWGKLVNVKEADGGLVGDLHYLKSHSLTEPILESIERFEDTGLSHDASGMVERRDGETVVTKIEKVHSVDFVEEAATNRNLFEGVEDRPMKKKVLAVLREGVEDKSVSRCLARLAEQKDAPDLEALEMEVADGATDDQILSSAGSSLFSALFEGKTFSEGVDALRVLVEDPAAKSDPPKEDQGLVESLQRELQELKEERAREKSEASCRSLLEAAGVEVTDKRLEYLMAIPEGKRQNLVDEFPKKGRRPDRSPGVTTRVSEGTAGEIPKDFDLKNALSNV